jgi:hypothetical protein
MISFLTQQTLDAIARTFVVSTLLLTLAVAYANEVPAPSSSPPHQSVFDPDVKQGKDPFFPKSVRREERTSVRFEVIKPTLPPIAQLTLNGLSTRFALINNKSFAENEINYVRTPSGQQLRIHCRKITRHYVLITIDDDPEPKQLRMREF